MPIDPADLVISIARLWRMDFDRGLDRTLRQVMDTANNLLDANGAELMLADSNGQLRRASASNQQVQDLEEHQDRAALILSAAALATRTPISVRDIHQDPDSYELRAVLHDARIVAALTVPIELNGDPIGTLGIYSATPRDWTDNEVSGVQAYAGIVANLLAAAVAAQVQGKRAAQLQTALDHRTLIEQAKGILMAKQGIDAALAFDLLRTVARSTRRPIVDVAHDLIAGHPLPNLDRHATQIVPAAAALPRHRPP